MPFRDSAWGMGCVTGRLFPTSAENWDWKGRSGALGLCLCKARASVREEKNVIKLWVMVSTSYQDAWFAWLLPSLKSKEGNQKRPRRDNPVQRRNQDTGQGKGGLAQGPRTKEGRGQSQILGTSNLRRNPPNQWAVTPIWHFHGAVGATELLDFFLFHYGLLHLQNCIQCACFIYMQSVTFWLKFFFFSFFLATLWVARFSK